MVRKNDVAALFNRLEDNLLRDIQGHKYASNVLRGIAHYEPGIVIARLEGQRGPVLERLSQVFNRYHGMKIKKGPPLRAALSGYKGNGLLVVLHFFFQTRQAVQITQGGLFNGIVHSAHGRRTAFVATLALLAAFIAVGYLLEGLGV